jgi:hypothetical protein
MKERERDLLDTVGGRRCCFLCGFLGAGVRLGERRRERL